MKNKIVIGVKKGRLVKAKLDSHVLAFSSSQSGKSVSPVILNTLKPIDSVIAFDIKHDIFEKTCTYTKIYNQNVFTWDFANSEMKTQRFNPHDLLAPLSSCVQNLTVVK